METNLEPMPQLFHPVILGSDIGAYNLARSMNDTYGVVPTVLAKMALGPVNNSKILDLILIDPEISLVQAALDYASLIAEHQPGAQLVLLANSDTCVFEITERRAELEAYYRFAFPSFQQVRATSGKMDFFRLAQEHGLSVPPTFEIDLKQGAAPAEEALEAAWAEARAQGYDPADASSPLESYRFPLIIKANTSYGYEYVRWPGKKKVYTVYSLEEYRQVIAELVPIAQEHEGVGKFVVQPRILGNDTHNLSVTAYVGGSGQVSLICAAQVLLEDHSPTALGNPGAMLVQRMPVLEEQAIAFLEGVGWHGFANFDGKVDPNTGTAYFLEVNPRIGRNNYYLNLAGLQPMRNLINDLLGVEVEKVDTPSHRALYHVLPLPLVKKYVDKRLWHQIRFLKQENRAGHPLVNPLERDGSARFMKRMAYIKANALNHWRKFQRNYPRSAFLRDGSNCLDVTPLTKK